MLFIRPLAICAFVVALLLPTLVQSRAARLQEATPVAQPGTEAPVHLGGDLPGDPQIALVQIATGLSSPTNVAFPPDDSGRIFVTEQGGTIRIVNPDGSLAPEPFLQLPEAAGARRGEQGLLGLAFHPKFNENGRFYVDYNNLMANGAITVSEFQVSADNPNLADPTTERPLLVIEKPYPTHNGGTLRFGPDGFLYVGTGDGGWQGDPLDSAQSRFTLLGKILRIDVDGATVGAPYGIPADNPFAGPGRYDNPYPATAPVDPETKKKDRVKKKEDPSGVAYEDRKRIPPVRKEIWAYGFRNPWQFSFDPATGDVYISDVGAENWEEINVQPAGMVAGQNYGWDYLEASHCFPKEITACPRQQIGLLPVAEYAHGEDGCAVIGIGIYRGEAYPSLDGIYFSGDLCTGEVRGLQRDAAGIWQFQTLLDTALMFTGAAQDATGALYVTSSSSRDGTDVSDRLGALWKVVAADRVPEGAITAPLGDPQPDAASTDAGDASAGAASPVPAAAAGDAPTAPEAAETVGGEIAVLLSDMFFRPERITIPADTDVALVLENRGATEHNFSIVDTDVSVDVAAGDTAETTLNLPPGRYRVICDVPGHKQAGMTGILIAE